MSVRGNGRGYATGRATKQGYLDALIEVTGWLSGQLGNSLPSQVHKAGNFEPVAG